MPHMSPSSASRRYGQVICISVTRQSTKEDGPPAMLRIIWCVSQLYASSHSLSLLLLMRLQPPDNVQEELLVKLGKSGSSQVLTHLRREPFHASWHTLFDSEFIHAYEHGMAWW